MPVNFLNGMVTKSLDIVNSKDRIFEGIATVDMVDKEGEIIVRDTMLKQFPMWMKRGAPVCDTHSNRVVGKGLNYEPVTVKDNRSGKSYHGIKITAQIHKDYDLDDAMWKKVKSGEYKGLSLGGANKGKREPVKQVDGTLAYKLDDLELYEMSICRSPMNPLSVITKFSQIAKSQDMQGKEAFEEDGELMVKCEGAKCYTVTEDFVNKGYIKGSSISNDNMVSKTDHKEEEREEKKPEDIEGSEKAFLDRISKMIDAKLKESKEDDKTVISEESDDKEDKKEKSEIDSLAGIVTEFVKTTKALNEETNKRFESLEEELKSLSEINKEKLGTAYNDGGKDSQPSEDPKDADSEGSDDKRHDIETKYDPEEIEVGKADYDYDYVETPRPYGVNKATEGLVGNAVLAKARELGANELGTIAGMINKGEFGAIDNPATRGYPSW